MIWVSEFFSLAKLQSNLNYQINKLWVKSGKKVLRAFHQAELFSFDAKISRWSVHSLISLIFDQFNFQSFKFLNSSIWIILIFDQFNCWKVKILISSIVEQFNFRSVWFSTSLIAAALSTRAKREVFIQIFSWHHLLQLLLLYFVKLNWAWIKRLRREIST